MKETFSTFSYKSIDDVTDMLQAGDFMAVTDIASAYRSVHIRPCDRTRQGLSWILDGTEIYLEDNLLSFGTRAAPFIFFRITDAVVRYLVRWGIRVVNYLDDFIVMGSSYQECHDAQLTVHKVIRQLGFYIAYPKVISPAQKLVYLGLLIDSVSMKLSIPDHKLVKLYAELAFFEIANVQPKSKYKDCVVFFVIVRH